MKIIYAIVSSDDGTRVTDVLTENHFSVTRLATTGGFLKKGNATLMIGTGYMMTPVTVELGGATIFVTDVERFEKI